jgi:hypothetical protein
MKCLCNDRNAILYIQDIKIINAFHNGVLDIKTVEEIGMKKAQDGGQSTRSRRRVHRGL